MPTFGICSSVENAAAVKAGGWDYVEGNVQTLFMGLVPDDQWTNADSIKQSALPIPAANVLVPATLKITGPNADPSKLQSYMSNVIRRAAQCGTKMLVFGSGGARNVPDGFDRGRARQQIIDFAKMAAAIAQTHGVTIVAEHLNRKECNIINSVAEAQEIVNAVNHPNFQNLVDSYHFWLEDEPLSNLKAAMPWIKHVHVADKDERTAPGQSGKSDYKPFFRVLKEGRYDGCISVEAGKFIGAPQSYAGVLKYLKDQWANA